MRSRRLALAAAALGAVIASAAAAPSHAYSPYSYRSPGYIYSSPPYAYQPPPYSYMPPSYSYEPPGYVYTPPGQYRRGYRTNVPDYNAAYDYPYSAYGDRRARRHWRRQMYRDPYYNRFGNPRDPSDVWRSAPTYDSPGGY
jgi:hypothetical protein